MADETLAEKLDGELVILVPRGDDLEPKEAEGVIYTHAEFLGAFQQAILDRIEFTVVPGMSHRRAMKALAHLRTAEGHHATLVDALRKLREHGHPVDPATLREGKHRIVAAFAVPA